MSTEVRGAGGFSALKVHNDLTRRRRRWQVYREIMGPVTIVAMIARLNPLQGTLQTKVVV